MVTRFKSRIVSGLWVVSISTAMFGYGFLASQYKLFPYSWLRDARIAWNALFSTDASRSTDGLTVYTREVLVPTAISHCDRSGEGAILVCAGNDALKGYDPQGCMAWIMDRDGQVLHAWKSQPQVWDQLHRVTRVPGLSGAINPSSIHLYENGDILANYHGFNTFPFAIGLARFDVDSKLLWKKELLTHHLFSVAEDGRIFVPSLEIVDAPLPVGKTFAQIESATGKVYRDLILVLDANGNELDRISILDALVVSGWTGLVHRSNSQIAMSDDPLHLNDAHLVGKEAAQRLPGISAEDLLVSMRNINTIGILDPSTKRFKWLSTGATMGQHSPRIHKQGILVFDNLGGDISQGGTRLVHVDLQTGLPATLFPRPDVPMPDLCRSVNSGCLEMHQDGRHALMTITHEGTLWEVDLETGKVVWEYIYVDELGTGTRQLIGSAQYVDTSRMAWAR